MSPPTCLRRVQRLREAGVIERQVALLSPDRLGAAACTAIVEVTLDRQGAEHLDAFEARAVADDAVQQCYRVSPGPDFVLVAAASPTCRPTTRWRSACSPATPTCAT